MYAYGTGPCTYSVTVPLESFGDKFFLSGEARFTGVNGAARDCVHCVIRLPDSLPPLTSRISFYISVLHPHGSTASLRVVLVGGVEVLAASLELL